MTIKVVVIGGVAGGATCAARIRRQSETAQITLFERGSYVSFANCGLPYYVGNVIEEMDDLILASPQLFKTRFNVNVQTLHEVKKINTKEKNVLVKDLQTGTEIVEPYDYLVISTGSFPIRPPLKGIDTPGIFSLRTIPDSEAIRTWIAEKQVKSAVVVGGGFIGLEMTENLVRRGIKVEIVEGLNQVMPPIDFEMANLVHNELAKNNVNLHLNSLVSGFSKSGDTIIVETKSGKTFTTDMVLLSIGVRPETAIAKEAGLELGQLGGIRTNERMQTSDPFVYAVGDSVETKDFVTGQWTIIPLANPANRQGRVAADNIINPNGSQKYRGVQGTAVCKVFDLIIASTGANEKTLKRLNISYDKVHLYPNQHVSYFPGAKKIAMKILFDKSNGRLLGAQAVGEDGVEKRIDVVSLGIQSHLTVYGRIIGDAPLVQWTSEEPRVQLLDVRSADEHKNGHVENSILIPLPELRNRLNELDKSKPVDVYCAVGQRGYYATRLLRLNGFNARNFTGGYTLFKQLFNK